MKNEKYELAVKYCRSAIKLHERGTIPPYPKFYELFYTYVRGTHPSLNERLNAIFAKGDNPSAELVEALYNEFLCPRAVEDRLNTATNTIADQINQVSNSIKSAISNADEYSDVLNDAIKDLSPKANQETINSLIKKLLKETKLMQETNVKLEKKLAIAKTNVNSLKSEIDNVRRDAMLDPLTKVNNRKSFDKTIKDAIKKAEENGNALSFLMIDIDHFKQFNDNHGHQTGDQVLRLVAATLSSGIRDTDFVARYGGEEFVLILPDAELNNSIKVAEKLRISVKDRKLKKRSTNKDLGRVTISIGVASFRSGDTDETLIERADRALYAAKHAGRNRVVDENSELLTKKVA